MLSSAHPETPIKIPTLALWTPNNGHLGIQSFSFGSVSGWTLSRFREIVSHSPPNFEIGEGVITERYFKYEC